MGSALRMYRRQTVNYLLVNTAINIVSGKTPVNSDSCPNIQICSTKVSRGLKPDPVFCSSCGPAEAVP
jgi:hypothetical protein